MKNYLVSIIVPAYNVEQYINKCVESLINQSYKNIEIIIVNDGSNDGTLQILEQYSKKDKRINVITQENGGVSKARNTGIVNSSGEYIACVDSDDYVAEDYIEKLVKAQIENNVDIVCCSNKNDFDGVIENSKKYESQLIKRDDALAMHLSLDQRVSQVVWGKLFKKSLFDTVHFIEGRWHEDTAIIYQLIDKVDYIYYLDYDGYYYVQRKQSIVHLPFNERRYDKALAYYEMSVYFKDRLLLNEKANNLFVGNVNYVVGESYGKKQYNKSKKMILEKLKEIKGPFNKKCKIQRCMMLYCPLLHKFVYRMLKK